MERKHRSYTWTWLELSNDEDLGSCPVMDFEDLVEKCSAPYCDRWNNRVRLGLNNLVITRPLLTLMVQLLNEPVPKNPNGSGEEHKWLEMVLAKCRFQKQDISPALLANDEDGCTLDDMHSLVSAIASRTACLFIRDGCPEIVSNLLMTPFLEAKTFRVDMKERLSDLEYARLGSIIERSVQIKELSLKLPFTDAPQELFDGLANATHIEDLCLKDSLEKSNPDRRIREVLSNLVVRDGGYGALARLLRNPQNRLKKLDLSKMCLGARHLIDLLHVLPASHVEDVDFSYNMIKSNGILELARNLPRFRCLKRVSLRSNPWEKSAFECRKECGAALLQGVMENVAVVFVDNMDLFPQVDLLWHYVALNHAGRRILDTSNPVPDGLWPLVLSRAGRDISYSSNHVAMSNPGKYNGSVNAIFFLLQCSPRISLFRHSLTQTKVL